MASSRMTAPKGRTYDRTVPDGSNLHKHLACRAVPHMSQSQSSTPIPRLTGSNLHAETHRWKNPRLTGHFSAEINTHFDLVP